MTRIESVAGPQTQVPVAFSQAAPSPLAPVGGSRPRPPAELVLGRTTPILALEPPTSPGAVPRVATRQPRYPFAGLDPSDSERLYRSVYPQCTRGTETAEGRMFSRAEIEALGRAMYDVSPLLRCPNHPARYVARLDTLLTESMVVLDDTDWPCDASVNAGESPANRGFIAMSDRAVTPGVYATGVHELVHQLLQAHDPRTCGNYPDHRSPLLLEWARRMGWDDKLETIERPLAGEDTATEYGKRNAFEDMAESFEKYFTDPVELMATSPTRFRFCDELIAELRRMGELEE